MAQRFTDKKTLTKLVNMEGWKIYRDSKYGMYALNEEKGLDIYLMYWNVTLNDPKLAKAIDNIRSDIQQAEEDNR